MRRVEIRAVGEDVLRTTMDARRAATLSSLRPHAPMGPSRSLQEVGPARLHPHLKGGDPVPAADVSHEVTPREERVVSDVMSTGLVTTGEDVRLDAAARLLRYHDISGLPVVHGTRVEGVLSERDILRALAQQGGLSVASEVIDHVIEAPSDERQVRRAKWRGILERLRVKDIMTKPPITVTPDTTVDSALRWMLVRHIQRLLVMEGPHLVGIVTRGDVMTSLERES